MIITEGNYLTIAMKNYDNFSMNSVEELDQDLLKAKLIQRQFNKYRKYDHINERLLINHFICFTNVFDKVSVPLLQFIINDDFRPELNALLFVFDYLVLPTELLNENLVKLLYKEINEKL